MSTEIDSEIHRDAVGCRKMIVSMITHALKNIEERLYSPNPLLDWHHAYNWILSDSFKSWCDDIDFDCEVIREQVKKQVLDK